MLDAELQRLQDIQLHVAQLLWNKYYIIVYYLLSLSVVGGHIADGVQWVDTPCCHSSIAATGVVTVYQLSSKLFAFAIYGH